MKRLATSTACAVLSIGMLSACGGGTDAYCSEIESTQESLGGIDTQNASSEDFKKSTTAINKIADKAPDDIKSEWQTIGQTLKKVQTALDDAGLKVEDLQDPQKMKDVDPAKLKDIQSAASDMTKVADAQEKISKQVENECDIQLGSGSDS